MDNHLMRRCASSQRYPSIQTEHDLRWFIDRQRRKNLNSPFQSQSSQSNVNKNAYSISHLKNLPETLIVGQTSRQTTFELSSTPLKSIQTPMIMTLSTRRRSPRRRPQDESQASRTDGRIAWKLTKYTTLDACPSQVAKSEREGT